MKPAIRVADTGADIHFFFVLDANNSLLGVARCQDSVVPPGPRLYTRTESMTFLWDLCDTPHKTTYALLINCCFYCFISGWLKINQFADLDGISGLKA